VSASVIVCDPFSTIVKIEINQQLEQQINIKFLVKLGKSGPKICQILRQAYGEDGLTFIVQTFKLPAALHGGTLNDPKSLNLQTFRKNCIFSILCT
jgi:hypothetical protein